MRRRRNRGDKIAFNFDSFLDVVTNVVGIILRLILVAWVGARAYKGPPPPPPPALESIAESIPELPEPTDPLADELLRQRRELTAARARLETQIQEWEKVREQRSLAEAEWKTLQAEGERIATEQQAVARMAAERGRGAQVVALSLADLQARGRKLHEDIETLRKAPSLKQTLRHRTPVSRPLQSEELLFECREGKITFIDVGAMLDEIRDGMREKAELLRSQWEVADTTQPVGPFRLRYVIEREKTLLEGPIPTDRNNFRYGLSSWEVVPIASERGESVEAALAPGSAFRRVIEAIDPLQTAVTLCVYPDSFPQYRTLRDWLHERDVVVAGRPLPATVPIASSRRGSVSRGQ